LAASPGPNFYGNVELASTTLSTLEENAYGKHWSSPSISQPYPDTAPVITFCEDLLGGIDKTALSSWTAVRHSEEELVTLQGKSLTEQKTLLVEALWKRVKTMCFFTWEAARIGGEFCASGKVARPAWGEKVPFVSHPSSPESSNVSLPPIDLLSTPPTHACDSSLKSAVAALHAWSPAPCLPAKVAATRAAGTLPEGQYAPLIALEMALREGSFAVALDICKVASSGGSKAKFDGLRCSLQLKSLFHIQVYCAARLGWVYVAGKMVGEQYALLFNNSGGKAAIK